MRSYTNDLNERGLLVIRSHVSSCLLLSHLFHYIHIGSEEDTGRKETMIAYKMIITRSQPLLQRRLHFCSQISDRAFARPTTFPLELRFADLCHRSWRFRCCLRSAANDRSVCQEYLLAWVCVFYKSIRTSSYTPSLLLEIEKQENSNNLPAPSQSC